jgi:hypothetical protein
MMNCSTSALGRALGMMIPFGKMASFEEVQNRQNDAPTVAPSRGTQTKATSADGDKPWPVSKSQLQNLAAIGYDGPVPADWKEANAIIKQMGKT